MVLHTINASPASPAFRDCLLVLAQADAVILMGDGVYAARQGTSYLAQLLERTPRLYVLQDDATAAGVLDTLGDVEIIAMEGFVELSENYSRQLAWY